MKKLIFSLAIFVIFVIAMGLYLLLQNEERIYVDKQVPMIEINIPDKPNKNSDSVISKMVILDSKIPLEVNDYDLQTTNNESQPNISTKTKNPDQITSQAQIKEQENSSPSKYIKQKDPNSDLNLKQTKINASNIKPGENAPIELSDAQNFDFRFSLEYTSNSSKTVSVSIPIKTHTGKIEDYHYSAKLEKEQFSISWVMPGWFQMDRFSNSNKDVQLTFNSITFSNLTALKNFSSIYLYKKLPIELTFETADGATIPDGTKIKFLEQSHWVNNLSPFILNQKGIIYIEPDRVLEITSMSIGQYYSDAFYIDSKSSTNLARTIQLKKKVLFKAIVLDQKQQPISDHFIIFSKSYRPNNLYQVLADYETNSVFDETKYDFFHKTDSNGEVNGEIENTGEYYVNIFGPKIKKGIVKKILISSEGEKINIQVDLSTAEIKLNFLENGKPFIGELNGFYSNNGIWGNFTTNTGILILNKLPPGKVDFHLKSKVFINTTIKLTIPEDGTLEKDIELKPGAFLSGTLTTNNTPILGKKLHIYLYEKGNSSYDHSTETDLTGHFQFTGLNPEIIYIFHVDLKNYILDPIVSAEYRISEKEVLVNLIEKFDFAGMVFDEKGLPVDIVNVSASVLHKNKTIGRSYITRDKNIFKFTLEYGDTISFCIRSKDFANHYQTVLFEPSLQTNPLIINLKEGVLVKGIAVDTNNNPLFAGLIVEAIPFEYGHYLANRVYAGELERTALGAGGSFQIENAQIGERFFVLSKGNSPIPFTIEEKHRHTLIELQTTKSYSFSGNLRSQKNVLQEGRRVMGERVDSKEYAEAYVDAKGNFFIDCLRPGKWVFTSNFRDMYKVVPRIEIEIIDKNETYDWVVHR